MHGYADDHPTLPSIPSCTMPRPALPPRRLAAAAFGVLALVGCATDSTSRDTTTATDVHAFATRYTAAWCSQEPARVAAFFAEDGSLTINGAEPAVGREAIAEAARGFMTAFPDLVVAMDSLHDAGDAIEYHWTLTGTNTGPGGTGRLVRISGYEAWTLAPDGLIAASDGHFDEAEYRRQLERGGGGEERSGPRPNAAHPMGTP